MMGRLRRGAIAENITDAYYIMKPMHSRFAVTIDSRIRQVWDRYPCDHCRAVWSAWIVTSRWLSNRRPYTMSSNYPYTVDYNEWYDPLWRKERHSITIWRPWEELDGLGYEVYFMLACCSKNILPHLFWWNHMIKSAVGISKKGLTSGLPFSRTNSQRVKPQSERSAD